MSSAWPEAMLTEILGIRVGVTAGVGHILHYTIAKATGVGRVGQVKSLCQVRARRSLARVKLGLGPKTAFWPVSSQSFLKTLTLPAPPTLATPTAAAASSMCGSIQKNLHVYLRGVTHWDAKVGNVLQVQNSLGSGWSLLVSPSPGRATQAPCDPRPVLSPLWMGQCCSLRPKRVDTICQDLLVLWFQNLLRKQHFNFIGDLGMRTHLKGSRDPFI